MYIPGVNNDGVFLNKSAVSVGNLSPLCMGNIHHCFFGLTVGIWFRIDEVDPSTNNVTIFEMGGNSTFNESGVSFVCSNSSGMDNLSCKVSIINSTERWSISFALFPKLWMHVGFSWNPFRTLKVYLNGHCLEEFNVYPEYVNVTADKEVVTHNTSGLWIGQSRHVAGTDSVIAVDEGYIIDRDVTDEEMKRIFGKICRTI